jgi:hypothetical protein
MMPAFILWSILAAFVIGLAVYRKLVAYREDDMIHVGPGEERLISQQLHVTRMLDKLDRLVKILTVVTALFGLILLVFYLYSVWLEGLKPVG